jgi:hypothetical protein
MHSTKATTNTPLFCLQQMYSEDGSSLPYPYYVHTCHYIMLQCYDDDDGGGGGGGGGGDGDENDNSDDDIDVLQRSRCLG